MNDLVDVTVHIDEYMDREHQSLLTKQMRDISGVIAVGMREQNPHLMIVEYDPDTTCCSTILTQVSSNGLHAELIGL